MKRPLAASLCVLTLWTLEVGRQRFGPMHAEAVSVAQGYFTGADGMRLFYRQVGHGKDVVVLLHGGPGLNMGYAWPDLMPLAEQFTVLMYDQRGAGRSQVVTDTNLLRAVDHVRDLEALRQHFGLERMTVIGLSWGGGLALLYAADHPEHVRRMLLLGPMPPTEALYALREKRLNAVAAASLAAVPQLMQAMSTAADPGPICREFVRVYFSAHFADRAAAQRLKMNPCDVPAAGIRNFPLVAEATMGSLGHWNFLPLLAQMHMPVLVVDGAKSPATLEGMHVLAGALPNGRLLLIPNAGHYAQVEQPDLFFPAAETFLHGQWPVEAIVEPPASAP